MPRDATPEERASLIETQQASATPEMAVRIRRALDEFDVSDCLSQIVAPTLVIHANGDAVNPLSEGRYLATHVPGAELQLINSNNHIFLRSDPAWSEIMTASLDFLRVGQ